MHLDAHLQMIHSSTMRLSTQSTTVKGWTVTLTAALLGFSAASTPAVSLIAAYVVVSFALLDAYYLALERNFRKLYRRVAAGQAREWTLTADSPSVREVGTALLRPAILLLYGPSLAVTAGFAIYLFLR